MPSTSEEEEEWIPAREAAQLLARSFGGITRAQRAIAIALHEGLLSAGAESTSIAEGHDADFVDEEAPKDELLGIPTEAWTNSEHFESDRLKWDWDVGDFDIHNVELGDTYIFEGVHFLVSELEALAPGMPLFAEHAVPSDAVPPPITQLAKRRGPKPSMRWAALIEAVLELERNGELVTGGFDGPGALMQRLQLIIPEERQFDDRSIEPVVSYIFEHLLCGPPKRN